MKNFTIIEYQNEEYCGVMLIKNYTYDKKYVDKVMKNLAKNKFKTISCYECDEYDEYVKVMTKLTKNEFKMISYYRCNEYE